MWCFAIRCSPKIETAASRSATRSSLAACNCVSSAKPAWIASIPSCCKRFVAPGSPLSLTKSYAYNSLGAVVGLTESWGEAQGQSMVGPDGVVRWSYMSPPLEVPGANLIFDALEQRTPA